MTLVRFDPFRQMQESMGRFLDRPLGTTSGAEFPVGANWTPVVDIQEKPDAIHVTVELPGVDKKDIQVSIENNVLIIPGNTFSDRDTHFRISYAASNETIREGCAVLRGLAK